MSCPRGRKVAVLTVNTNNFWLTDREDKKVTRQWKSFQLGTKMHSMYVCVREYMYLSTHIY